MNDLHDLLETVSEPPRDRLADSHALLHEGRRRVRRRRTRIGGGMAAAALVVAGVGAGVVHSQQQSPAPAGTGGYADLDLTALSKATLISRCAPQMTGMDLNSLTLPRRIPHHGHNDQAPWPFHTGSYVHFRSESGGDVACQVPETSAALDTESPVDDDPSLQLGCGKALGIDLSGWQQLAAQVFPAGARALYRSGNGFIVGCTGGPAYLHPDSFELAAALAPAHPAAAGQVLWDECGRYDATEQVLCYAAGHLTGDDVTRVAVTLPDGAEVQVPAVDGWWVLVHPGAKADITPDDERFSSPGPTFPAHAVG